VFVSGWNWVVCPWGGGGESREGGLLRPKASWIPSRGVTIGRLDELGISFGLSFFFLFKRSFHHRQMLSVRKCSFPALFASFSARTFFKLPKSIFFLNVSV
jgi:hypothetical protein